MDFLLKTLKDGKVALHTSDKFIGPCCNVGWAKLKKYYSLTDRLAAYTAAIVCCPQYKWQYFTDVA